jgi:hypothetical protein
MLFSGFHRLTKANQLPTAYIRVEAIMRQNRDLAENVWYRVWTDINVSEPLFLLASVLPIFCRMLIEAAKGEVPFEMRGLRLEGVRLSFYIKPADGYELPKITRWMMNISS